MSENPDISAVNEMNEKINAANNEVNNLTGTTEQTCSDLPPELLARLQKKSAKCIAEFSDAELPPCPKTSGSFIVPDSAPMGAAFIYKFNYPFIEEIGKSTKATINIVGNSGDSVELYKSFVSNSRGQELWKKYGDRINFIPDTFGYEAAKWIQDSFQPVYSSEKKQFSIAKLPEHSKGNISVDQITDYCEDIEPGATIKDNLLSYSGSSRGGDLEPLPNGEYQTAAAKERPETDPLTGSKEQPLRLNAGFLRVGHVDEMFNTIQVPGEKPPCNYAVISASPKKMADLIEQFYGTANSNQQTQQQTSNATNTSSKEVPVINKRINHRPLMDNSNNWQPGRPNPEPFQEYIENATVALGYNPTTSPEEISQYNLRLPYEYLSVMSDLETMWKETRKPGQSFSDWLSQYNIQYARTDAAPDSDTIYAYEGSGLQYSRDVLQPIIDSNKRKIENELKTWNQENGCPNPPRFIDLPVMWGMDGLSVLPNVVNGVPMDGGHYYAPLPRFSDKSYKDPELNEKFLAAVKQDIEKAMGKYSIKVDYVDDYNFYHKEQGEIHCGTNTIRVCK